MDVSQPCWLHAETLSNLDKCGLMMWIMSSSYTVAVSGMFDRRCRAFLRCCCAAHRGAYVHGVRGAIKQGKWEGVDNTI